MRRVNSVRVVGVCAVLAAVSSVLGSVVGAPVVGAVVGETVVPAPVAASVLAPGVGGLGYVPLAAPCRVVDTRVVGGALVAGGSSALRVAGTSKTFLAQGGTSGGCGIPDGVGLLHPGL